MNVYSSEYKNEIQFTKYLFKKSKFSLLFNKNKSLDFLSIHFKNLPGQLS